LAQVYHQRLGQQSKLTVVTVLAALQEGQLKVASDNGQLRVPARWRYRDKCGD